MSYNTCKSNLEKAMPAGKGDSERFWEDSGILGGFWGHIT